MGKSEFRLEDFNHDIETNKIISCPKGNVCIESEFIPSKRQHYARFGVEQCSSCNFIKHCPIKIKNNYSIARIFKKSESTRSESLNKKQMKKDACLDNLNKTEDFLLEENGLKYLGESTVVIVPESINGKIVDKIAPGGFAGKKVKKVFLPNTIKVIGRSSFADCSELTKIIIPDSVTNIEAWAFGTCISLSRIKLSDNLIEIGSHAFDECYSLEYIKLPERINYIGAYAFCETALKKIVIPKDIEYLANSLFYDCRNLSEVVLPEGLETIGIWTFGNCTKLSRINLPESTKTISDAAFENCLGLRKIRIPESLIEMSESSFDNCVNLIEIETDDINKKVMKFNIQKIMAEGFGLSGNGSKYKDEYDTIYNILLDSIRRWFHVIPIHKDKKC